MKDNKLDTFSKNEKSRNDFGVGESGIDESGLLKKLEELKISSNEGKAFNINNRQILLDPDTTDEKDRSCKHETEGYREIDFEKGLAKFLNSYTQISSNKALQMKEVLDGTKKDLLQ